MEEQQANERAFWLAFSKIPGLGSVRIQALLQKFGSLQRAWHADDMSIQFSGLPAGVTEAILSARKETDPVEELRKLEASGVTAIALIDTDYPEYLREISSPPAVLYVRGTIRPEDTLAVAVVGTRRATKYGVEATRRIVTGLAHAGVTIVSGLALGIDAIAHQAALEAGGRTIAVLGCGVDVIYPARNARLAHQIAQQGALVSEYALGTQPESRNFPPRNRIISGLSRGVLIVEAGERSGALITAQFALDQGRDTYAVPGSVFWPLSFGTNRLIQRGEAKLTASADDILEELNLHLVAAQTDTRRLIPANENERHLLAFLTQEPQHVDEIGRQAGLSAAVVASTLTMLELKGIVRSVGSMHYVLIREEAAAYDAN